MVALRERKKLAVRQAISDAATRLFEARGFEAVTLAEIAAAADVSVKTIWNHFGSKEELFFDREDAAREALLAALADRPAGTGAVAALSPLFECPILAAPACRWSHVRGDRYDAIRAYTACEHASPTLRARRLAILDSWTGPLAGATGSPAWAAMLVGVLGLRHRVLADAFARRLAPRTIERRVRATVREALAALERAFPDI